MRATKGTSPSHPRPPTLNVGPAAPLTAETEGNGGTCPSGNVEATENTKARSLLRALQTNRRIAEGGVGHADGISSKKSTCQLSVFVLPSHKTVTICATGNWLMMMPSMRRLGLRRSPCDLAFWLNFTLTSLCNDRYELPGRCLKSSSGLAGLRIILNGIAHSSTCSRRELYRALSHRRLA